MKAKSFFQLSAMGAFTAIAGLAFLSPESVSAQTVAAEDSASITIMVPADGTAVSYTVGGATFWIQPGNTVALPAAATNIQLTPGAVVIANVRRPDGSETTANVELTSATTLPAVTSADISQTLAGSSAPIQVISITDVQANGDSTTIDVANRTTTVVEGNKTTVISRSGPSMTSTTTIQEAGGTTTVTTVVDLATGTGTTTVTSPSGTTTEPATSAQVNAIQQATPSSGQQNTGGAIQALVEAADQVQNDAADIATTSGVGGTDSNG
ncbi:hypothetical protein ACFPK9_08650 [Rubritalea spongiae]|uniref:Uncharacterized protein n=1 Tax=Rubritalea spongiae TaxID=430797 RepID=A0ABW5E5K8_9BACT